MLLRYARNRAGDFPAAPRGWALHASRSGQLLTTHEEFVGTSNYGVSTLYAFNWCVGDNEVSVHLEPWEWGWHAYSASNKYIAIELAQSGWKHLYQPISDDQVNAAAWCIQRDRDYWRTRGVVIPLRLRTHAELERDGETVQTSGKTDTFPYGDARTEDLRGRLLQRLEELGET